MIWLALIIALVLWGLWMVTDRYLVDPAYAPEWHPPKCRGRGCGYAFLLYAALFLFLLLPVWIKAPTVVTAVAEVCTRVIALLYWSFDRRPDFAVGPHGVYGLCRLRYHHVPWSKVGGIQDTRSRSIFGTSRSLIISTSQRTKVIKLFQLNKMKPVKFVLAPIHGIDINAVIEEIRKFAPDKTIRVHEFDQRPSWMR
ncbi:MAG: hypothetical protein ABL936_10765 [Aestuariivirga sp.]